MTETKHTTFAEELSCGHTVTYFTVGVSMRPLLIERETHVMIAPVQTAVPGDILLYTRRNGSHVLHRCIRADGQFCYMRGDNTYGLEKIHREQVLGVVTHIYRKGRRFDTNHEAYRRYVSFWNTIYPFRWLWWKIKRTERSILRRIVKWTKEN